MGFFPRGPRIGPGSFPRSLGIDTVPSVSQVNANSGRVAGGLSVTITGRNFRVQTDGTQPSVSFGSNPATSVVVVSSTQLTCVTPATTAIGVVSVSVTCGTQSGLLENAFTYIAGSISSVTPNHSIAAGGVQVRINGINFVAGSTIAFGTVAATGVVFVDSQNLLATVPASTTGARPVDVTITEPTAVTVVGAGLFRYTSVIPNNDIRRSPSITIRDLLNNAPNTATFTVDGKSAKPAVGSGVEFVDNGQLVFSGQVTECGQIFEDAKENLAWPVTAIDYSYQFNRKRPFGTYDNQSVTDIVKDLVARYAPGFRTNFVQTGLARVSVVYDGSIDLNTCLSDLCQKLGEGHFYLDYNRDLHLYHVPLNNQTVVTSPRAALELGPGTAMTVTNSTTRQTGAIIPGYYYFKTCGKYNTVPTFTASVVSAPSGYVQLSDQAATLNLTGAVSNGSYSPDGVTFFPRGWVGYSAGGVYLSSIPAAFIAGQVWYASQDVATVLEERALGYFETAYSPISNLILITDFVPAFANIPVYANISGVPCSGRKICFIRFGNFHKGGGTGTTGYLELNENVTTTLTSEPTLFYHIPAVKHTAAPTGPTIAPYALESTTPVDTTAFLDSACQPGYYAFVVSGVYKDGTESYPTPQSNTVLLTGPFQALLQQLPIFPDVNGVPCIFRKIYSSIYQPYHPLTLGTPNFALSANLVGVLTDNAAISTFVSPGSGLSGGDASPDRPDTNRPLGTDALATGHTDGPWLEDASSPDEINDTNMLLIRDPQLESSEDISQLRNRFFVKGKGTILVADAAIGDTKILVADVSIFSAQGGKAIISSRIYSYVTLSANTGAGALNLSSPLTEPILQADWKFGGGTPVRLFVQVDDVESQRQRGLVELDAKTGLPTDGIHEDTIDDQSLTSVQQCIDRGLAALQLFSRPIVKVDYATRDPKHKSGKIVHFNLTNPPLVGSFVIQEVTIDQYHDENDELTPRYRVSADSAARFNFNDLMLYLDDRRSDNGVNMANLVQTAVVQVTGAAGILTARVSSSYVSSNNNTVNIQTSGTSAATSGASLAFDETEIPAFFDSVGYRARRDWVTLNTSSTPGAQSGILWAPISGDMLEQNFDAWFHVKTPASMATGLLLWVGMFQLTVPSDIAGTNQAICALRYANYTGAIDSGWTAVLQPDGIGHTQTTKLVSPIGPSSEYLIRIQSSVPGDYKTAEVSFTVNGTKITLGYADTASGADMPTAGKLTSAGPSSFSAAVNVTNKLSTARKFNFRRFYCSAT